MASPAEATSKLSVPVGPAYSATASPPRTTPVTSAVTVWVSAVPLPLSAAISEMSTSLNVIVPVRDWLSTEPVSTVPASSVSVVAPVVPVITGASLVPVKVSTMLRLVVAVPSEIET